MNGAGKLHSRVGASSSRLCNEIVALEFKLSLHFACSAAHLFPHVQILHPKTLVVGASDEEMGTTDES